MHASVHAGWFSKSDVIRMSSSYIGVCLGHAKGGCSLSLAHSKTSTGLKWTYPGVGVVCRTSCCTLSPNSHLEIDEAPYMSCEVVLH